MEVKQMSSKSGFEERLMKINVALENCLKPPVIDSLTTRGYGAERINGILDIHTDVNRLNGIKDDAYNKQFQTTDELNQLFGEVRANYSKYRKLGRVSLSGQPTTLKALKLSVRIKSSLSGFVSQARHFYVPGTQDETLVNALLDTGLTREELEAELPKLAQLEQLNIRQEYEKKVAQDATQRRDERMAELDKCMADLYKVGQVALADLPQFLELLKLN
jgi:hypothetical protein